ncbi:MAG TPA: RecQ family ATP-dependent DNA helicase [Gaiellaceae bacterium]|nr:RecQ family ATP-dependent DNA helicase [Gaiellaceae bacterium]
MPHDLARQAREALGFELRPEQVEAAEAAAAGRDVVAVMPTGSGKSAIYQAAGLVRPGATVVVSPLIALQRDQLESIADASLPAAAALNSSLKVSERRDALERLDADRLEFLFLAPEQLANEETLARVRDARPSLLVVDEAHCVSEWGHDFRPDYLRLGAFAEELGRPPVLALTATASPPVREEIVLRLGLVDPLVVVHGFDRPNIHLSVELHVADRARRASLLAAVADAPKPGIVYAATRARADETATALAERGVAARAYHAGMSAAEREEVHAAFAADELDAIVATTAFGMGVDKPNVRFVFHLDGSDSVDAYYQEVGRGGRDGEPAAARLFFRPEDLNLRRFFGGTGNVDEAEVAEVVAALESRGDAADPAALQEETGLSRAKLTTALARLEEADAVEILPTGDVVAGDALAPGSAADAAEAQEKRRSFERSRLEMLRGYAELRGCRRAYLLNYFGEAFDPPCGNCDNCEAGTLPDVPAARPFAVGARVRHASWGEGAVQRYESDTMVVLFDEVGYRTLAVELVVRKELLEAVP